jgi:hypothetical protein
MSQRSRTVRRVTPAELRQRVAELEAEVQADGNDPEDHRSAAELLAALAEWDAALLRRAAMGESGEGNAGVSLLYEAVDCAEDESG